MLFVDLPVDVTRIIAALLVNNRPLLDVVRTYASIGLLGRPMYALQEAMTESLACGPLLMHPQPSAVARGASGPHMYHNIPPPFPGGVNSVKASCIRDRLRQSGLKVSGVKAQIYARLLEHHAVLPPVPYNVIPSQLRQVFAVPNDARITVTEAKTTYRLKEEHLEGLDEELKTNPVRRSAPAMRLYLKREVMLAQWAKDDKKLRDKAERDRDRAINGPRPRPPPAPKTPAQLARTARKTRKIALTSRLEDHGLELRSDSRMCEEYIQYGGHIDAVVEMMVEMEFFVTRTRYSEFFDQIVDEFERVHWRDTHLDREMWEYRERWDRDEVSHEAKDMALDAYMKAGLGLALIPEHLVHV